jgi:hypothetical protein
LLSSLGFFSSVLFLLEFFLIMFSSSELLHSSSSMFVVCSFLEIHVKKLHVSPRDCRLHSVCCAFFPRDSCEGASR